MHPCIPGECTGKHVYRVESKPGPLSRKDTTLKATYQLAFLHPFKFDIRFQEPVGIHRQTPELQKGTRKCSAEHPSHGACQGAGTVGLRATMAGANQMHALIKSLSIAAAAPTGELLPPLTVIRSIVSVM